jgi:hypothetical protein
MAEILDYIEAQSPQGAETVKTATGRHWSAR